MPSLINISTYKEQSQTAQPLMLVEINFSDGSVLRLSSHDLRNSTTGIQYNGFDYMPRIVNSDTAATQALSSLGADVIPSITLKLADPDRTLWQQYEKTKGFTGALCVCRFVFFDVVANQFSSDSRIPFVGICEAPSNDDETLTIKVTSKMNMAKTSLPWCKFQRNCGWNYPDTSDLVDSSGNYLSTACANEAAARFQAAADDKSSSCWNCGYSPTATGGNARGNLDANGKPYTTCDKSRASCLARLGNGNDITKDGSNRRTARFGGISWQVPTSWSGTPYGSNKASNWNPNWNNDTVYNQYLPIVYGTVMVYPPVLNCVGEANSTRGEAVVSYGPLLAIYNVNVNDHDLPQSGGISFDGSSLGATPGVDPLHRFSLITTGDRTGNLINDAGFNGANGDPDPHGGMCLVEWVIFAAEGSSASPPTIRMVVGGNKVPSFCAFTGISSGHLSLSNNLLWGEGTDVTILGTGNANLDGKTFKTLNNNNTGFDLVGTTESSGPGYFGGSTIDRNQNLGTTPTGLANSDNSNVTQQFISGFGANPIWVLMDVMIRAGWNYTDFYIPDWIAAANICDRQITRSDGSTGPLFSTSLVLKDPKSVSEIVRGLRLSCRATLAPAKSNGALLGVQIDGTLGDQQPTDIPESNYHTAVSSVDYGGNLKSGYVAYRFSDDDGTILRKGKKSSFQTVQQPINQSYNSVSFSFMDSQNSFVEDAITVRDSQAINNVGQEVSYNLPVLGCNTYDMAQRVGSWFIASKLEGNPRGDSGGTWTFKFDTSFRAIHLRIGDIIMVNSVHDGISNVLARVTEIVTSTNFETLSISATWHLDEWYLDTYGTASFSLAPVIAASLVRPPLPWIPNQATPVNTADPFGQNKTFDLSQTYKNQNGDVQPQIVINGAVQSGQMSSQVVPPLFDMVPTFTSGGGTIQGGYNYALAVCTYDANGNWSAPSNVSNVQIPAGLNNYTIKLTGFNWQERVIAGSPVTPSGYGIWMGTNNNNMTLQASNTSLDDTLTLTSYSTNGIGLFDPQYDKFNAKIFQGRHTGSIGAQITASGVTTSTIKAAGSTWATNCFANRVVSIIGKYGSGLLPVINFKITSNTSDTLTVAGNPQAAGVTDGDLFVVRFGVSSSTNNSVTDNALDGATQFDTNSEAGKLLWITEGKGAGQTYIIASNTGDTISINGEFTIKPDSTSSWIITEPTVYDSQDSKSMPMTMDVANESGSTVVVRVDTVDPTGQVCVTNLSPWRDIYIFGAMGTRIVLPTADPNYTAANSGNQTVNDGRLLCDATHGNITVNLLADTSAMKDQELVITKTDSSTNTVTIATNTVNSDTFRDPPGATTLTLSDQGKCITLRF